MMQIPWQLWICLFPAMWPGAKAGQTRARETAAYAFAGDWRVRATWTSCGGDLAMESTVRFWNTVGKSRLVGSAVRVGERQFPALHAKVARCADVLHIPLACGLCFARAGVAGRPHLWHQRGCHLGAFGRTGRTTSPTPNCSS